MLTLKRNSKPVTGTPYADAIRVRDAFIEDRESSPSDLIRPLGEEESQCRQMHNVRKRLYFDDRMEKFWTTIRKKGPKQEYLEVLDRNQQDEEDAWGGALRSRQQLHEEPTEYALLQLTIHISTLLSLSSLHPWLLQDNKQRRRDAERVLNSLRSAAQVLKSVPYFDVPVLQVIDPSYLRDLLRRATEDSEIAETEDELVDLNKIADSFAEDLYKNSRSDYYSRNTRSSRPASLSELLSGIAEKLSVFLDSLQRDPFNPKPNEDDASVRSFCRRLDFYLRENFGVSSPAQVANCANVVLDIDVDAADVKRWRVK